MSSSSHLESEFWKEGRAGSVGRRGTGLIARGARVAAAALLKGPVVGNRNYHGTFGSPLMTQ